MSHKKSYNKAEKAFSGGDYATALMLYRQIFADDEDESDAVWGIAECFHSLGERGLAVQWYRKYLEFEPDEPEAMHMLASLGDGKAPARASDDYVIAHFDRFADDFDKQLLDELDYKAPELLAAALGDYVGVPAGKLKILDAGCGTGLCAPLIKPFTSRLDGVDLSGEMLKFAKKRKLYDSLHEDELIRHLEKTRKRYDVILSADTFCYFGALDALLKGCARAIGRSGWLLFSVEAEEMADSYRLSESGRYVHSRDYIGKVAVKAGFRTESVEPVALRTEYGEPVIGDIWVMRRD